MRDFVFTLNNFTEDELASLKMLTNEGKATYICWGVEKGENNTPHLQGYIEFPRDRQLSTIKRMPGCKRMHLEARAGTQTQAIEYTKKDGDWVEYGHKKCAGERTDLKAVIDKLKSREITLDEIVLDYPNLYNQYNKTFEKALDIINRSRKRDGNMPECIWLYGETGSGKSHKAFTENPDAYVWGDNNGWWDTYDGHECVILNEFRGQIPFNQLLTLCDKWDTKVPRRGKEPTPFIAKKIVVTSALRPSDVFHNLAQTDSLNQLYRRFQIYYCEKDGDTYRCTKQVF